MKILLTTLVLLISGNAFACQKFNIQGTDYWLQSNASITNVGYGSWQGCFEGLGAEALPRLKRSSTGEDKCDDNNCAFGKPSTAGEPVDV